MYVCACVCGREMVELGESHALHKHGTSVASSEGRERRKGPYK